MKLTEVAMRSIGNRLAASQVDWKLSIQNAMAKMGARWRDGWKQWKPSAQPRLYIAAASATAFMIAAVCAEISAQQRTQAWNQVYANGAFIGYVPDEPSILSIMSRTATGYHVQLGLSPVHTDLGPEYDWTSVQQLPTKAAAIVLNGKPVVYTRDVHAAATVLNDVRQSLIPPHLAQHAVIRFVGSVGIRPSVVGVASILSPRDALRRLLHPSMHALSARAAGFNVGAPRLSSHRGNGAKSFSPLLHVDVSETVKSHVSVAPPVHFVDNPRLSTSVWNVLKPGKAGEATETIRVLYRDSRLVAKKVVNLSVIRQPQPEVVERGTNSGVATGDWVWPSDYHDITSPFGMRDLDGVWARHPGVDIGCPIGSPVYATNNGVVEDAGWNSGGYGNWVKINNGNGIETVFGHLSRVTVSAGETVAKGQLIGYSGDTGFTTGPHLHYEVRKWGTPIPPDSYM